MDERGGVKVDSSSLFFFFYIYGYYCIISWLMGRRKTEKERKQ